MISNRRLEAVITERQWVGENQGVVPGILIGAAGNRVLKCEFILQGLARFQIQAD